MVPIERSQLKPAKRALQKLNSADPTTISHCSRRQRQPAHLWRWQRRQSLKQVPPVCLQKQRNKERRAETEPPTSGAQLTVLRPEIGANSSGRRRSESRLERAAEGASSHAQPPKPKGSRPLRSHHQSHSLAAGRAARASVRLSRKAQSNII